MATIDRHEDPMTNLLAQNHETTSLLFETKIKWDIGNKIVIEETNIIK